MQGSQPGGQVGSQNTVGAPGQGWFGEHGVPLQARPASLQEPHTQWPVAALQVPLGTAWHPAGQAPLVSKHGAVPQSQHTGILTQSHTVAEIFWHTSVGSEHPPMQPAGPAWQRIVVLVLVLVDVLVLVVETFVFLAGVHRSRAFTNFKSKVPNWSVAVRFGGSGFGHDIL